MNYICRLQRCKSVAFLTLNVALLLGGIGCEESRRTWTMSLESGGGVSAARETSAAGETPEMVTTGGTEMVTGGVEGGIDGAGMGMGEEPLSPLIPGPEVWARLTESQYRNMINDVLGIDTSDLLLEPDTNPYLFNSIGAGSSSLSSLGVEQYAEAAFVVAERYFETPQRIEVEFGCLPMNVNDGCADQMIRQLGLRLYRRPLTQEEVSRWLQLAGSVVPSDRPEDQRLGLETALAGILQSPSVLYRIERGEVDLSRSGQRRFTALEMASRIAFTLQDTSPDLELLTAALDGRLEDPVELSAQLDRLLESERTRLSIERFFEQYLDLGRLAHVERDPTRYEGFTPALLASMETEVRLLVNDLVFRRDGDIRRLFDERRAYLNSTLAEHYGVSLEEGSPVVFEPISLGVDTPRVGFLGTAAFLTMNAHPTETSPTLRGKYIRERLLCQVVPPPPDDIDLNLEPETGEASTLRERLELHREDPACMGCHSFIDPPGFLFEFFDSVGRYRETLDGVNLDASGNLDGVPMENLSDLADFLADDPRLTECMTRQVYRFALGRLETVGEESEIQRLHQAFATEGYRFKALFKQLLMSDGFTYVSTHPNEEVTP